MKNMLIPNRPQKGKNIDEILAGMPKEGEETKALPAATAGFSIKDFDDYYRITGISYRGEITTCDLNAKLSPALNLDEHARCALKAKQKEFRAASASLIYSICKALYQNRHMKYEEVVEKARNTICSAFETRIGTNDCGITTLSEAVHEPQGIGKVIHEYRQPTQYVIEKNICGLRSLTPIRQAAEYAQAVLGTNDRADEIDSVLRWITARNPKSYCQSELPEVTSEYSVILRICGETILVDTMYLAMRQPIPALLVRQKKPR